MRSTSNKKKPAKVKNQPKRDAAEFVNDVSIETKKHKGKIQVFNRKSSNHIISDHKN